MLSEIEKTARVAPNLEDGKMISAKTMVGQRAQLNSRTLASIATLALFALAPIAAASTTPTVAVT